jgi:hypothetical protein
MGCALASSLVKMAFYNVVGLAYDMTPSTAHDDFWLYDYPINPINIPSAMIFNKPNEKTPEEMMDHIVKNLSLKSRTRVKCVVKFGKYFFKEIPEGTPEYQQWRKENMVILWDVKTDQELLDFFCKIKKLDLKGGSGACQVYYVPDLNKTEAAIISIGHHVCHDGVTQMQAFHEISDEEGRGPFPFMKRPVPSPL